MWITGLIGFLVVDSMRGHPGNGAAFECERATDSKKVLKGQGHSIGTVCVQSMVTHTDAQAGGNPKERNRNGEITPGEH